MSVEIVLSVGGRKFITAHRSSFASEREVLMGVLAQYTNEKRYAEQEKGYEDQETRSLGRLSCVLRGTISPD